MPTQGNFATLMNQYAAVTLLVPQLTEQVFHIFANQALSGFTGADWDFYQSG